MNVITTTEIRTKMPEVIATLLAGKKVDIIHRSKIIGEIIPKKNHGEPFTKEKIRHLIAVGKKLSLPKLTDKQIEKKYRAHLMKKYGQGLS